MPRPRKFRRVCGMPPRTAFGPMPHSRCRAHADAVVMTVDEYETIRLIDYEGMNQEECAARLDVARTTAQRIYDTARRKQADCLVNGRVLRIEGGDYVVCAGGECPHGECRRHGCEGHHGHGHHHHHGHDEDGEPPRPRPPRRRPPAL